MSGASDSRDDLNGSGRNRAPRGAEAFSPMQYPHLFDLLRVLSKRRWAAILSFAAVVGSAAVYTYTATPIYEARAQLQIDSDRPKVVVFEQTIESDSEKQEYQQTQVMILQSRALARRTMETLHLWNHPAFGGASTTPKQVSRLRGALDTVAGFGNAIVGRFTRTTPDEGAAKGADAGPSETELQAHAINLFLNQLTVTPLRGSRLVDVNFRSEDSRLAELVANTLVKGYVDQNLEFKSASSREASSWLGKQLEEQRQKVDASQSVLQRYREETDSVSSDDRESLVVQKLNELNAALTRAKTERIQREAMDRQVRAAQNDTAALDSLPIILGNGLVQSLKTELANLERQRGQLRDNLGERHPEMVKLQRAIESAQARLTAEEAKAVSAVHNDFLSAQALEQSLVNAVEGQKQDALRMKRKGIQGSVLERNATSDREIFEALLQRTKEAGVSGGLPASNIRIVDAADLPRVPISPRKQRNMLMSVLGGLMLSIAAAFFFEYMDKGINSPDEVKAQLGLNCLGLVPLIDTTDESKGMPLLSNEVSATFREAFRSVRTNVIFASAGEASRTLLITSTGPHEGKTVVAANLAIALAQTGQRVLLVDADMRRPRVHEMFQIDQAPGLSNLVEGRTPPNQVIRRSDVEGLALLPAGAVPPNPAELLSSPQFKQFVTVAGQTFDWVIIDSPPVMAVTDASVIANITTGVLFVVGAEQTLSRTALNALDQLETARARFVGAVLNRVDLERNAFFYSYYYRREYTEYYSQPTVS